MQHNMCVGILIISFSLWVVSPLLTWGDNIKMHRREIAWGAMYWLAQDREQGRALVNKLMNEYHLLGYDSV
jgi:hypothetical protein